MLSEFTNYLLNIKGYSQRTTTEYAKDINYFSTWAKQHLDNPRWSTLTRKEIDMYISDLAKQGLAPSTTNRRISAISALYRWLKREGKIDNNPCRYMARRKDVKHIPSTIPAEDLQEAYNHAYGMMKVIIGLLATTGMRISELQTLRLDCIDFKSCLIEIRGKGKKERIVHTLPEVIEPMRSASERLGGWMMPFANYSQRELRYQLYKALAPYSRAKQLSPHAIRHTFATNLATNGVNVTTIAQILGHSRIDTTQKYIDLSQARTEVAKQYSLIKTC